MEELTEVLYVLEESGPNGKHILAFQKEEDAEKTLKAGIEFWKEYEVNKVPMRTYRILKYISATPYGVEIDQ